MDIDHQLDVLKQQRRETIYSKGFNMLQDNRLLNYRTANSTIRVGPRKLNNAVLDLGDTRRVAPLIPYHDKRLLLNSIIKNDYKRLREFSNFFYKTNGIYSKLCQYVAFMYRYDWYLVPEVLDNNVAEDKILKDFSKMLNYLDNSYIKKVCGEMALKVLINGCYYGYLVPSKNSILIQELPVDYCRTTYSIRNMPVVEFNMKYFDEHFKDSNYRMRILNLFPEEFKKGYALYKRGKLLADHNGDGNGWYVLEPGAAFKFNLNNNDAPVFIDIIPLLLDLDAAQDLDRRKQMQQLLKIIIQKLPMDKNGELVFDVDEARDIHNNAVAMLQRAIGVDVLTTFADVESIDMSDKNTTTTKDDLEKVERAVYNSAGISKNVFNTTGNLALEKSILEDESSVRNLLLQFIVFFDNIIQKINTNKKKYAFRFYMLETTQYNYQALSKMYKEQAQMGHSKILPQIALGHSQSFILNTAYFENKVLHLTELMLPNLLSSTMNLADLLGRNDQNSTNNNQKTTEGKKKTAVSASTSEQKQAGRPEKDNDQKSEKTIQNKESMN